MENQAVVDALSIPEHKGIIRWDGESTSDQYQFHFSLIRLDVSETCEEADLAFPQ
jgi:hypothetical protein